MKFIKLLFVIAVIATTVGIVSASGRRKLKRKETEKEKSQREIAAKEKSIKDKKEELTKKEAEIQDLNEKLNSDIYLQEQNLNQKHGGINNYELQLKS